MNNLFSATLPVVEVGHNDWMVKESKRSSKASGLVLFLQEPVRQMQDVSGGIDATVW